MSSLAIVPKVNLKVEHKWKRVHYCFDILFNIYVANERYHNWENVSMPEGKKSDGEKLHGSYTVYCQDFIKIQMSWIMWK